MSDILRVYLDPAEVGLDGYPLAWHGVRLRTDGGTVERIGAIKDHIRDRDEHRCLRCHHPYPPGIAVDHPRGEWTPCDEQCRHPEGPTREITGSSNPDQLVIEAHWRILTVHHLNGIKYDCRWWNLVSLCQRCHLTIQGKVFMERPWTKPHSYWFRPFVAGFYAWKYLNLELTQEETLARMDELLDLELTQEALF